MVAMVVPIPVGEMEAAPVLSLALRRVVLAFEQAYMEAIRQGV